jgi:sortase A
LLVVVAEGTGEEVLRRAAGRLVGGALPGEDGNLVLAGHRDTFFRPLREIEIGDPVVVERASGVDVYTVEWTRVVGPRQVEVTRDAGYPALTLITCYPFRYIGEAPERFVVRARRTERIAQEPPAGPPR